AGASEATLADSPRHRGRCVFSVDVALLGATLSQANGVLSRAPRRDRRRALRPVARDHSPLASRYTGLRLGSNASAGIACGAASAREPSTRRTKTSRHANR